MEDAHNGIKDERSVLVCAWQLYCAANSRGRGQRSRLKNRSAVWKSWWKKWKETT